MQNRDNLWPIFAVKSFNKITFYTEVKMESSGNGSSRADDAVVECESVSDFEERLQKDNLRVMAEMYEGVYLKEYLQKYGQEEVR
ncbi:hypothetical protein UR09_05950 [Candidatus Nitromaritima sp. SCGC AAA799-A02]|nr:hypothetical protein UR09_05950 [Candidatus Nitromaritima sp. SCGC AAA799-A02]KMP12355.1 hypothetical protein UZ36_01215 [Candidatus Nitromaritima sp. SCGC AAA799-C22]